MKTIKFSPSGYVKNFVINKSNIIDGIFIIIPESIIELLKLYCVLIYLGGDIETVEAEHNRYFFSKHTQTHAKSNTCQKSQYTIYDSIHASNIFIN